ncbi:MAG TPA: NADH:ubiquinone reductase (Na(+)-transporting) subunit B [Flavobacteriales bacterium]|jgi:Na+-transporting NADH:ubiquinone oxidoreductase subunit B|nr:NADH:ubiquinone reductase (Na(+)-transporting) subunit B [Flavobacteriales bacterium]
MRTQKTFFDKIKPQFQQGGKYEKFYYALEAFETFLYAPNSTTGTRGAQIRDGVDLKRMMMTVILAMVPCLLFGIYNVGYQHFLAIGQEATLMEIIGVGLYRVLPIVVVSYASGLGVEFIFSIIRRHPVNEGFLVSGMLIPLIVPPTIPLWQVALATIFAVLIGKEVFGGTGMNIFNVALTARAFLYFAYPSEISGEVWTYIGDNEVVNGYSGATPLAAAVTAMNNGTPFTDVLANTNSVLAADYYSFANMFFGFIPGSIGETSTLMALIGAFILIATGVGSWKIIFSVFAGAFIMGLGFNAIGVNEYMNMPAHYHLVIGGLAFGAVFMATDPVTASQTERGKWIYGFLIGVFTVIIRVVNPAYPEGIMLAILFMNVFAPLIDFYVIKANKKRRLQRATV